MSGETLDVAAQQLVSLLKERFVLESIPYLFPVTKFATKNRDTGYRRI